MQLCVSSRKNACKMFSSLVKSPLAVRNPTVCVDPPKCQGLFLALPGGYTGGVLCFSVAYRCMHTRKPALKSSFVTTKASLRFLDFISCYSNLYF